MATSQYFLRRIFFRLCNGIALAGLKVFQRGKKVGSGTFASGEEFDVGTGIFADGGEQVGGDFDGGVTVQSQSQGVGGPSV